MNEFVDRMLDRLFVALKPVAGACPVCALIRGAAIGFALGTMAALLVSVMAK